MGAPSLSNIVRLITLSWGLGLLIGAILLAIWLMNTTLVSTGVTPPMDMAKSLLFALVASFALSFIAGAVVTFPIVASMIFITRLWWQTLLEHPKRVIYGLPLACLFIMTSLVAICSTGYQSGTHGFCMALIVSAINFETILLVIPISVSAVYFTRNLPKIARVTR